MATPDSSTTFVEELHKRWFDNVKDYMDKKKEREDNQASAKKKVKTIEWLQTMIKFILIVIFLATITVTLK